MKKILLILSALCVFLYSCAKDEPEIINDGESVPEVETVLDAETVDVPVIEEPGNEPEICVPSFYSFTTGLPCNEDERFSRPIAVMYNNNHASYPQNSISRADIVYECNAEGGMTRLMAIFSDWKDLGEIGSIRSARDYFVSLSESHGAIYVNAGGSPSAYEKLINADIDYLDGVNMNWLPKNTFYRSTYRIKNNGYEHSMMTDGTKILSAVDQCCYSKTLDEAFISPLLFSNNDNEIKGEAADSVYLNHSAYITVRFDYDELSGTYAKYSFDEPHRDGINGEQLKFKNVIVLFVKEKVVDEEGRLDIDLTSGGIGYYFCNGNYVPITWTRSSDDSPFTLSTEAGALLLSPGKTHITLFNQNCKNKIIIK